MTLKILVTGGAGYLGSTMVPNLLQAGHKVTVVDNFMYNQASLNHICNEQHFDIVNGDIRSKSLLESILPKFDVIIPLAAFVGAPLCNKDPIGAKTTNYHAIIDMMQLISKNQIVIMPTTNSAYGTGDKNNFCDENSPLNPISSYAKEKVEVEKILLNHENSISFRLATVFGFSPRMRIDLLVNDFTYRAVKDKYIVLFESKFKRNYIHVRDVSLAFLHAINNFESMKNQIFNVGLSDANISKFELCKMIQNFIPDLVIFEEQFKKDEDQRNYIVSNAKIESSGFKPKYTLNQGILELIKGYKMLKSYSHGNV